jgi:hypothetical protein
LSKVQFSADIYNSNNAQTIMIYLYGGASELAGNLSNLDAIQEKTQNPYNLDRVVKTSNNFWKQAGGEAMERMLENGDMNIFRTCYRQDNPTRSHGVCTAEHQRGQLNVDDPTFGAGIFSNLGKVLLNNGVLSEETVLPFVTMEGESGLFSQGPYNLEKFLKPAAIDEGLSNPYNRDLEYPMYTRDEWDTDPRPKETEISITMDAMAKELNQDLKIQNAFNNRASLDSFIKIQKEKTLPSGIQYPDSRFGRKLKTAIGLAIGNSDTKVISVGGGGLGGWDDHSDAISDYSDRMRDLMSSIEVAMAHLKEAGKSNVNIIAFCEFGRNANLNDSEGWDHGNNQNVYIFGGGQYLNHLGIVGETELSPTESNNRLYLRPTASSYTFEPYAVAASIYKMYGITNPELLTQGYSAIDAGLFKR